MRENLYGFRLAYAAGQWSATRFGVRVRGNSRAAVVAIIARHVADRAAWIAAGK